MSITNTSRPATGETWATWLTAWQDETRTWAELGSFIDGTSKVSSVISNFNKGFSNAWDDARFNWDGSIDWDEGSLNGITNINKPTP